MRAARTFPTRATHGASSSSRFVPHVAAITIGSADRQGNSGSPLAAQAVSCALTSLRDERPVLELLPGLAELVLRVHHDRPVPGHRLRDRLAGDQQEADALLAGAHAHLAARVDAPDS